jgi:hypothetical protein
VLQKPQIRYLKLHLEAVDSILVEEDQAVHVLAPAQVAHVHVRVAAGKTLKKL